ncbi:hypothetical protein ScPMuIL_015730 [Solemya velum]
MEEANKKQTSTMSEAQKFDAAITDLMAEMTSSLYQNPETRDAGAWFNEMLNHALIHGKNNRGLTVVLTYKMLNDQVTAEDLKLARILGWCVELLQYYFLVVDDIMDFSETRRGRVCWHKKENVGMIAVNDSFYAESCIYTILKKYFREKPYYAHILELFHETTMQSAIGQNLDTTTALSDGTADFSKFTMDRYSAIVKWKTAYYSFYFPVALALHMAGINDPPRHDNAKRILLQMGHFFQVQDDFIDCYGDPEVTGKIGTDIADNKCSWLIVQALKLADSQQLKLLKEVYGHHDAEKTRQVEDIYRDLDLKKVYEEYENSSYEELCHTIAKCDNLPTDIFYEFAKKIYKRKM